MLQRFDLHEVYGAIKEPSKPRLRCLPIFLEKIEPDRQSSKLP